MKKFKKTLLMVLPMTFALAFPAFAGEWKSDLNGWWYEEEDGSCLKNGWYWLDGNQDGIAECYYFNKEGFMVNDKGYADGHRVDHNGAWVDANGIVQEKVVE